MGLKLRAMSETRPIDDLTVDPKNARRHSEGQIAQIVKSIERFGLVAPIVIRPNGQIIGGHATWSALKRLKYGDVDCRVVTGLSESGYRALGLALNKIAENSSWDDAILREVLASIEVEGDGIEGLGFSDKELNRLLEEPAELEIKEIETSDVDDEFWISVRGPLEHQAKALKALREALKDLKGVTVEQGTIAVG